jgi:hypothetical protein
LRRDRVIAALLLTAELLAGCGARGTAARKLPLREVADVPLPGEDQAVAEAMLI